MDNTKVMLQVPITKSLRDDAMVVAEEWGLSSIQDMVKVLIKQAISGNFSLSLTPKDKWAEASPEAIARYEQAYQDVLDGKAKTVKFDNVEDSFKYLGIL